MIMLTIRRWHSYIGLFIAPSVVFFALTGAVQLYNLHEQHGDYAPLPIVEKLSSVHKDQAFKLGDPHHEAEEPRIGAVNPDLEDDKSATKTLLLKGFFLVVALGLMVTTGFGAWMGLTQIRQKRLAWLLLIAGAVIPTILLVI